jgi:DNA ligase-1
MIAILAEMLKGADPTEVRELVYLSQGRLQPDFIQKEFGMNERLIMRSIVNAYRVPQDDVMSRFKEMGDIGLVAQHFAQNPEEMPLTAGARPGPVPLTEIYTRLKEITEAIGSGSQEQKVNILADILSDVSPLEAKHIGRIVVGRLRVGIGDPTLMDALSVAVAGDKTARPAIERAYNLSSDLGLVAGMLYGGGLTALENIQVRVGNPVRMALAERADTAEDILARLGKCAIEPKFDGFRMQIHKDGDTVSVFSRGLEDMSGMFPDVVASVGRQISANQLIMEGEALAYDPQAGTYLPFQVTSQRRRVHNIEAMSESIPLRLMAFDLLLLEGKDLTRAPYLERREALRTAIGHHQGMGGILVSTSILTDDPDAIVTFYEESLEEGFEGIVAKRLDGTYDAGKRGFNWIKMKRSYQSQMADTVDCAIVGYYYGKGRRASWGLGSLLVSVYDRVNDLLPTVTRVASGFSEAGWQELCERLQPDRIDHPDPRVVNIIKPDVWVVPRYVIELQADEVSRSQMHPAGRTDAGPGYALRFPRIIRERPERTPEDATTVEEVIDLYKMQGKGDTRGKRKGLKTAVEEE